MCEKMKNLRKFCPKCDNYTVVYDSVKEKYRCYSSICDYELPEKPTIEERVKRIEDKLNIVREWELEVD